jgi:hypothetical protein
MDINLNLFHFVVSVIYIQFFYVKCVCISYLLYGKTV